MKLVKELTHYAPGQGKLYKIVDQGMNRTVAVNVPEIYAYLFSASFDLYLHLVGLEAIREDKDYELYEDMLPQYADAYFKGARKAIDSVKTQVRSE